MSILNFMSMAGRKVIIESDVIHDVTISGVNVKFIKSSVKVMLIYLPNGCYYGFMFYIINCGSVLFRGWLYGNTAYFLGINDCLGRYLQHLV